MQQPSIVAHFSKGKTIRSDLHQGLLHDSDGHQRITNDLVLVVQIICSLSLTS